MKNNLLKAFALAFAMTPLYNCSVEPADNSTFNDDNAVPLQEAQATDSQEFLAVCSGSDPRARITNNGTVSFDYEIYDASGAFIIGIYNISPGTVTQYATFSEGTIIFNVETASGVDQKVAHLMENCTEINMEIDVNNLLLTAAPEPSTN